MYGELIMQLKPGDIVACCWSAMCDDETVKRSRLIVLDAFEDDTYDDPNIDDDDDGDFFLGVDSYVRVYCYDFEGTPGAQGMTFQIPSRYLVKLPVGA